MDGEKKDERAKEEKKPPEKPDTCDEDELIHYNKKRRCYCNPHAKCCCVGAWNLRRCAVSTGTNEIIFSSLDAFGYVYNFIMGNHEREDSEIEYEYRATLRITFIMIFIFHLAAGIIIIIGAVKRIKLLCLIHYGLIWSIIILYLIFITTILQNSEAFQRAGKANDRHNYDVAMKLYCGWMGIKMLLFLYDGIISISLFTLFRAGIMFDGLPLCGSYFARCGKAQGYPVYLKELCQKEKENQAKIYKDQDNDKDEEKGKENDRADEFGLSSPPSYQLNEEASTTSSVQKTE